MRDAELLLDPLARGRLRRLPADELGHLERRRRLRGQRVEEPLVVGRVLLVGEPRAEVERADRARRPRRAARRARLRPREARPRPARRARAGRPRSPRPRSGGRRRAGRWARSRRPARTARSESTGAGALCPSSASAVPAGASPPCGSPCASSGRSSTSHRPLYGSHRHGIVTESRREARPTRAPAASSRATTPCEVGAQPVELDLLAQPRAERLERALRVVAAPVEAPVDERAARASAAAGRAPRRRASRPRSRGSSRPRTTRTRPAPRARARRTRRRAAPSARRRRASGEITRSTSNSR